LILIDGLTNEILCIAEAKGSVHDFDDFELFRQRNIHICEHIILVGDKGFQGIAELHLNSITPHKKPRKSKLSSNQKRFNSNLSKDRVAIEHINRRIKRFKILSHRYRNKQLKHLLRVSLLCGIYNYELMF
jgi:hypothetical protein